MESSDRKILYLDDEIDNLEVFEYSFSRDYTLYLTSNTTEARKILEENNIEVIITDYKMPEMTWVEFLELINKEHPNTVRIILTGFHDYEIVLDSINRAKIFQFVTKPWKKQDLKIIIDNALEVFALREKNKNLISHLMQSNDELQKESASLKNIAELHSKEIENFEQITAHNLRGPIRSIGTLIEWLITDYSDVYDENAHEYLSLLKSRIQQLYDSMDGVLDYIKVGLIPASGNSKTSQIFKKLKKESWHEEDIVMEANVDNFPMNEDHALSICKELLKNSVEATDKTTRKIRLSCTTNNEGYEIQVTDNGSGIEKKYQEKVFMMFQSIAGEDGGHKLGLGLAIVDKLIKMYNGEISLSSHPGKGTEITLKLKNNNK